MTKHEIGYHTLRLGLAALFLWFGFSQLLDGTNWIGWVPAWATSLTGLTPELIVMMNGTFEVVTGALLALGFLVRPAAILLGLHLVVLVFEIGLNDIGVRDFGLMVSTFALAFLVPEAGDVASED